jgi:hypothetical protein
MKFLYIYVWVSHTATNGLLSLFSLQQASILNFLSCKSRAAIVLGNRNAVISFGLPRRISSHGVSVLQACK